jgi:glycosyltransferase involved in cell wall biosynthesis
MVASGRTLGLSLHVLQVIPSISSVHGGPSRAMRLIEQALVMQGIEVETVTTDDDGPGRRNSKPTGLPLEEEGVIRRYFPKRREFYKYSRGMAPWLATHVQDYDLLHIHALFSHASVVAARAARRAGVPYVIRPLGTLNRYGVEQRRPWLKSLSLKFVEGPILHHAAAVQFTAEAERIEAKQLGIPMNGVVIPLGITPQPEGSAAGIHARYPQLRDRRLLLFLSRLDPKKNVEGLLQAFSQCAREIPDVRLVIAGDGVPRYVGSLRKQAEKLGIGEGVTWTGHVEGEQKRDLFAAAHAFVLPSFSENFGIAAAEALMAGLPCVLGEGVALAGDAVDAGAGLASTHEPEAIARALIEVFRDEEGRKAMSVRARELAMEKYSVKKMGKRLRDLYEEILDTN